MAVVMKDVVAVVVVFAYHLTKSCSMLLCKKALQYCLPGGFVMKCIVLSLTYIARVLFFFLPKEWATDEVSKIIRCNHIKFMPNYRVLCAFSE